MMMKKLLLLLLLQIQAIESKQKRVKAGHKYQKHENVDVVVNKIGPFANPMETYRFYSLPFCRGGDEEKAGKKMKHKFHEHITGDRREASNYELNFQTEVEWRSLCTLDATLEDITEFKQAILNGYFFEMFLEDLPLWGYVGQVQSSTIFDNSNVVLYPHLHFQVGYNAKSNQLVSAALYTQTTYGVNLSDLEAQLLEGKDTVPIEFSYSVHWAPSTLNHNERHANYQNSRFYANNLAHKYEVHWLSIINSVVLVLLLLAFLLILLMRMLKQDFMTLDQAGGDSEEMRMLTADSEDEKGWKLLASDVFRSPVQPEVFSAVIGCGIQLLLTVAFTIFLPLIGFVSTTYRGSLLVAGLLTYCMASSVGAYVASDTYQKLVQNARLKQSWIKAFVYQFVLFLAPTIMVFSYVNTLAISYKSSAALPFTTILTVSALILCLSLPLSIAGNFIARYKFNNNSTKSAWEFPTRTTKIPRQIPELPWWKGPTCQMLVGGCLPFSAIYIELHYILASIWGHAIYTLFGVLAITFTLLVLVVCFITIALLYIQFQNEDHLWWWRSVSVGGSTGIFLFLYSFIYWSFRSEMYGHLQASFFFGYMFLISYGMFLMLGTCAWFTSLQFVKYIYSRIKVD